MLGLSLDLSSIALRFLRGGVRGRKCLSRCQPGSLEDLEVNLYRSIPASKSFDVQRPSIFSKDY